MPTYTVHSPAGHVTSEQKQSLAREITRAHNEVTGAQTFFAQVIFNDIPQGGWFVGGAELVGKQIFVSAQIRGGRPPELKARLLRKLLDVTAQATGSRSNQVWVYLTELEPAQMAEYGHVLPQPGAEAQWLADLPPGDRALMQSVGRKT